MRILDFSRRVLGICAAVTMPAACAPGAMPQTSARATHAERGEQTFSFTGEPQTFVVPRGVKRIKVTAYGASTNSARGAQIAATIPVTPGESLTVVVGGSPKGRASGFNGGGDGGEAQTCGRCIGSGGAGASDMRENGSKLSDRVIVAGGAGGEGGDGIHPRGYHGFWNEDGRGGHGGDGGLHALAGKPGTILPTSQGATGGYGGTGATAAKGGRGGAAGEAGASCWSGSRGNRGGVGVGGSGGINAGELALRYQPSGCGSCTSGAGGGGGGGYFGGGGGGGGGSECEGGGGGGGAGGGSSYVEKTATGVTSRNGGAGEGPGEIIISW
ncbi:MAG: hypothetical protein ABSF08_10660 [Candidatus Cybelea sp.]|jgi:hypothetical protein